MRFTLGTDASTLTHPVQLCLVAIPMIVPSTYRKCNHFPSSKTVTSGYDSLRDNLFEAKGLSHEVRDWTKDPAHPKPFMHVERIETEILYLLSLSFKFNWHET